MRMTRFMVVACCALLCLPTWAQRTRAPGGGGGGGGGSGHCPPQPATCSASLPVLNFGHQVMNSSKPPINGHNTIAVTCTRSPLADGRNVDVAYTLKAEPAEPNRVMRNSAVSDLSYLRYYLYIDPGRTQHWGDGFQYGTHVINGVLYLDDRNRVGSLAHVIYGTVEGGQVVAAGPMVGAVLNRLQYVANCY